MKLIIKKDKNRSIFHWIPTIVTIKFPKGESLIFTWGYYIFVLRDKQWN